MDQQVFTVRVPYGSPGQLLGQVDGKVKAVPATVFVDTPEGPKEQPNPDVLTFRFRLHRTMRDDMQIERLVDELNGGPGATADLANGLDETIREARGSIERQLWPEGRPVATGEALKEQERKIAELYEQHEDKAAIERMMWLQARQDFAASWSVLIIDPPAGWKEIVDKPLLPSVMNALVNAYVSEKAKAEKESGK